MPRAPWGLRVSGACLALGLAACSWAYSLDKLGPAPADVPDAVSEADSRRPCDYGWLPSSIAPTGSAYDLALVDLDGDRRLDLALARNTVSAKGEVTGGTKVLLGRGQSVFEPWSEWFVQTLVAMDLAVGDLNGDGRPDTVVALNGTGTTDGQLAVSVTTTTGTIRPSDTLWVRHPLAVEIGDVDGDRIPDVVAIGEFQSTGVADERVAVCRGRGDGTFDEPVLYDARVIGHNDLRGLAVADVTGDGVDDVIVTHWGSGAITILAGTANGGLRRASTHAVCPSPWGVTTGDFDGDRVRDLAVACIDENGFLTLLGRGNGAFEPGTPTALVARGASVLATDLNADGLSDIVVVGAGKVGFRLATGRGGFGEAVTVAHDDLEKQAGVTAGDIDGDGIPDVIVAGWSAESPIVLRGACK